jgi:hypothetical protein
MPTIVPTQVTTLEAPGLLGALGRHGRGIAGAVDQRAARKREEEVYQLEMERARAQVLEDENRRLREEADRRAAMSEAQHAGASLLQTTQQTAPQMLPGTAERLARMDKLRPHMSEEGFRFAISQFRQDEARRIFEAGKTKTVATMARILRTPGVAEDQGGAQILTDLLAAVQEAQTPQELEKAEKALRAEQKAISKRRQEAMNLAAMVGIVDDWTGKLPPGDDRINGLNGLRSNIETGLVDDFEDVRRTANQIMEAGPMVGPGADVGSLAALEAGPKFGVHPGSGAGVGPQALPGQPPKTHAPGSMAGVGPFNPEGEGYEKNKAAHEAVQFAQEPRTRKEWNKWLAERGMKWTDLPERVRAEIAQLAHSRRAVQTSPEHIYGFPGVENVNVPKKKE